MEPTVDFLAMLTAPRPTPATRREYWRCTRCLTIMATPAMPQEAAMCGACGGTCKFMGRVKDARLTWETKETPCDDRCTNARGPKCDCSCGSANHGSGMVVTVTHDAGPVPVLHPGNTEKARATADEFDIAVQAVHEWLEQQVGGGALADYRAGNWLSRGTWERIRATYAALAHAKGLVSHTGRLKALRAITAP